MAKLHAEKSQAVLDTLKRNVSSFQALLSDKNDELTNQNILRSIILFSCSGIDAIVKQLILESLSNVIERDEGAQEQLRTYTKRKIKKDSEKDYSLLADIFTAKNSRNLLIELLKKDLSYESLQNSDQLYKVAAYFNIQTDKLVDKDDKTIIDKVFKTRNIIVHQMDVDFDKKTFEDYKHSEDEVFLFYETIIKVSQKYIDEVNSILEKEVTREYLPAFSFYDGVFEIRDE